MAGQNPFSVIKLLSYGERVVYGFKPQPDIEDSSTRKESAGMAYLSLLLLLFL